MNLPSIDKYKPTKNYKNQDYWERMAKVQLIAELIGEPFLKIKNLTRGWTSMMLQDAYDSAKSYSPHKMGFYFYRKKTKI